MQRHCGPVANNRVPGRLNLTRVGMPQFRLLARHAEASLQIHRPVRLVGHIINVRIAGPAMDPWRLRIERARALEVLRDMQPGQRLRRPQAPHHPAFPVDPLEAADAVQIAPHIRGERLHFRVRIRIPGQARRFQRLRPQHRGAARHQLPDLAQHRQRHALDRRQHQHAVAHAVRQRQPPVRRHRHPVQQYVRIHVVVVVALRQGRLQTRSPDRHGRRRAFGQQIRQVGHELSLLQHEHVARQVGHVRLRLFRPRDVAVDVRAHHRVARLGIERLVRRSVEYDAVDALRKPVVANLLQRVRRLITAARERFRRYQVLSVNMRGRSRAAHVLVVHQLRMQRMHPELAHGDIHLALVEQRVLVEIERDPRGFRIDPQPVLPRHLLHRAVVGIGQQVGHRAAEIPQEAVADVRAPHHTPRQRRKVGSRVVAAQPAEVGDHIVGPVLHLRFPAIHRHVPQALAHQRPQRLRNRIEVAVKIGFDVRAAQFIGFETEARRRRRPVLGPGQRESHAQDGPLAGRHVPVQAAVLGHLRSQVDHIAARHFRRRGLRRGRNRFVLEQVAEIRLFLPTVYPRPRVQHKLREHILADRRRGSPGHDHRRPQRPARQLHAVEFCAGLGKRERPLRAAAV